MSAFPKSVANVSIDAFGFTFGVKVLSAVVEQTLSEVQVHGKCGRRLSFEQRCPHCNRKQKAPVLGGRVSVPKKVLHCTNTKCGKEISGAPVEKAMCESCNTDVADAAIKLAHCHNEHDVLLTDEERKQIEKLRTPKGIHIRSARRRSDFTLPQLMIRASSQVVPDKGSALHFETFRRAAKQGDFVFEVAVVLRDEKAGLTLAAEHMGLLYLDQDGTMVLTTFFAPRDVSRVPVVDREVPAQALKDMFEIIKTAHKPFGSEPIGYETPASQALWGLLAAKQADQPFPMPHPAEEKAEAKALASQLKATLDKLAADQKAARKEEEKKARKDAKGKKASAEAQPAAPST